VERARPVITVLQHVDCEPPGIYEDVMRERGMTVRIIDPARDSLPAPDDIDALMVMGGPMGASDDARCAWLPDERRLIRATVTAGAPFFGVCLGAQLLAAAFGQPVRPSPAPEVGVGTVRLTNDALRDPLFQSMPRDVTVFQWHSDTFDLPRGAAHLAESSACRAQAFRLGDHAYGLQFHLEVDAGMARSWGAVPEYLDALTRLRGANALETLVQELEGAQALMHAQARTLMGVWLDRVSN
jgi:GMP synthase-like glutamine amidotransferase